VLWHAAAVLYHAAAGVVACGAGGGACHLRVHQLGEVLQLVLLELLAWVGGAWRGREGQGLGSFGNNLGLSTVLGVLSARRIQNVHRLICKLKRIKYWLYRVVDRKFGCCP